MSLPRLNNTFLAAAALAVSFLPVSAMAETIKIGSIFPMTGSAAASGVAGAEGVKYAIEDVNAAGGITIDGVKYDFEYVPYDDQMKPAEAVSGFQRLRNVDGIGYIFSMISASHLALADMAERENVLVLTSAVSSKAILPETKHSILIYSRTADYVPKMIEWMGQNMDGKKVVLLYPNDESGWDFADMSSKAFEASGFTVVSKELVDRSVKDFQPVLTRIIASNPDFIDLGPTANATAGLVVRQARELGYAGQFTMTGGSGAMGVVAAAGPEAAAGLIHMIYADPANKAYEALAQRYRDDIGQSPNEVIVPFYDAARALIKAIEISGTPDNPEHVREVFHEAFPLTSLQGEELSFGGKDTLGVDAQILTTSYIARIENGVPVAVAAVK